MHKQETSKNESELQCSIREWRRIWVSSSQILFPGDSDDICLQEAGDPGLIHGLGRFPGEGDFNPLQ